MSVERRFDISLIASLALKEKQVQQNYRPIIAVHKWFARRPGTLFRGLLLSEFVDQGVSESYFDSHDLAGKRIADPFMGGGTPLIEANRIGCDVLGFDINPMATWIVREEIEHLDQGEYRRQATALLQHLRGKVDELYRTDCPKFGDRGIPVKYFLWVKTIPCEACKNDVDLFPWYLVADDTRHPQNVIVCSQCGELNEVLDLSHPGQCSHCKTKLVLEGPAKRNRCRCKVCGHIVKYPRKEAGPFKHRLFAIEYANLRRKGQHKGRFFKKPDANDLARVFEAEARLASLSSRFVPDEEIPAGDETDRLHRWGYSLYRELFNARQLVGLELSCRHIAAIEDERIRSALATNLSDLLRYQNMLCRYDTMALKSLDVFSVHGFPVGLIHCESNLLGITNSEGTSVGSGGWTNIIEKYAKAKRYCDAPFEIQYQRGRKKVVPIAGEWIGEHKPGARSRNVALRCMSSTELELDPESLDAVITDPPYFGNVQYAELMDFCFVWLRKLVGTNPDGFDRISTHNANELTVNVTQGRDLAHFTEGIAKVYRSMARALKPGAPLMFTYHHNRLEAYHAIGVAILDAGLTCSATLPCPAEMGGSIHIHSTTSSTVDTVFVCRVTGKAVRHQMFESSEDLVRVVSDDLRHLRIAGLKPKLGDIRCIIFGHLTRMAIWKLRRDWDSTKPTLDKLKQVSGTVDGLVSYDAVIRSLAATEGVQFTQPADVQHSADEEDRDAVAI